MLISLRPWSWAGLFLLVPFVAAANPIVVEPVPFTARVFEASSALAVEAGIVVFLLKFRGFMPFRFFCAYLIANAVVFLFIFTPLLWLVPMGLAELIVILIDALVIRNLAGSAGLQAEKCRGLGIGWALIVSAAGNAGSFAVGWLLSGVRA